MSLTHFGKFHKFMLLVGVLMLVTAVSFAQATPVPPVSIEIPVSDTITYLNDWVAVFAPIFLFIGMIPVALGLLRYITRLFQQAFGGGGR